MALSDETLRVLNAVVQTEEDEAAFKAGRQLASDPANLTRFGGTEVNYGKPHVILEVADQTGTWLEGQELPRNGNSIFIENPAFVLGSFVAHLETRVPTASTAPPASLDAPHFQVR